MVVKDVSLEELREARRKIDNGESQNNVAKSMGIGQKTLKNKLIKANLWDGLVSTDENEEVHMSTQKNADFTQEEIDVLKGIIHERKGNIELFSVYQIYDELSKVPTDVEQVRNAYNMSKQTTERLKKYASERRLPLQDLVELAVINLLDKYEK